MTRPQDDKIVREVFVSLGRQLSAARTPCEVAAAILRAADELFGYDAAFVNQYLQQEGVVRGLAVVDMIGNERREMEPWEYPMAPELIEARVISEKPKLILREEEGPPDPSAAFGDSTRRSASLMFAPVSAGGRQVGVLSIQSYEPGFYNDSDLELLSALGEFCGEALIRTAAEAERLQALEAVEREHHLLRSVINALPDFLYLKDENSRLLLSNTAHLQLLGAESLDAVTGRVDADFFPEEFSRQYAADERQVIATGEPLLNREEQVIDASGRQRWVSTSKVPLRDPGGKIIGLVGLSRDITDRKVAEEELFRSNARYQALLDASMDYIFVINREMRLVSANGVAATRYGLSVQERLGKRFHDFIPGEKAHFYTGQVRLVFESGRPTRYEDSGSVGGRQICTETQLSPIFGPDGQVEAVLGVSRDITERKLLEEELRSQSLVDELTGVYNRRGFRILAEQQLRLVSRKGEDLLLIFADLDGLKRINDTWGHMEGDRALRAAAQVLTGSFRQSDIVARLSGDEFTVLAAFEPGTTVTQIRERIERAICDWNRHSGAKWDLSLSCGTARLSEAPEHTLDALTSMADESLYEEKRVRRN